MLSPTKYLMSCKMPSENTIHIPAPSSVGIEETRRITRMAFRGCGDDLEAYPTQIDDYRRSEHLSTKQGIAAKGWHQRMHYLWLDRFMRKAELREGRSFPTAARPRLLQKLFLA